MMRGTCKGMRSFCWATGGQPGWLPRGGLLLSLSCQRAHPAPAHGVAAAGKHDERAVAAGRLAQAAQRAAAHFLQQPALPAARVALQQQHAPPPILGQLQRTLQHLRAC